MNLVQELAELALATRLKRLSERLSQDISKIYKELNVDFEAKWYLILELLKREKVLGITEISDSLQLSHPAVVQFVDQLLKRQLIIAFTDKKDARRRLVSLSPEGKKLLQQIDPVLKVIKEENRLWIDQASHDILLIITELEKALDERSMYQRVKAGLDGKKD
ncbi:MAG TPA: MarR family transcriptional regulator [Daejeonella sp.]|nr:MarR family transcriptional regulator [Daejeonella sp.]